MAVQAPDPASFYREGCYLDAVDSSQKWLVAFIMQADPAKGVLVRFDGWSKKWNEWLSCKSHRVAPFRRHTQLYTGQQSSAIRDWTYTREEVQSALETLRAGVDALPTPYDVTQFYRGHLFMLVDNLLAIPLPPGEFPVVVNFLNEVVAFIVSWLKTLPERFAAIYQGLTNQEAYLADKDIAYAMAWPELFSTLERLFGCEQRLQELLSASVPAELKLRTHNALNVAFHLQHHFIALFIDNECFKLMGDLLLLDDLPLQLIADFPLWAPFLNLLPGFKEQYSTLALAALDRLDRFSEKDQRNYDKFSMTKLMRILTDVAMVLRSEPILSRLEATEMKIALQLLTCKFLDKRVRGINNVTEGIQRLGPAQDQFRTITAPLMSDWLRKYEVLQIILTDRPHIEILKRSQTVFSFLAEKGKITQEDLEALWTSLADKHESYVRTVYELISSLASSLSKDLLNFIYRKMQTLDIAASPDYVIDGMKQFTISACISLRRMSEEMQSFCLKEFIAVLERAPDSQQAAQVSACVAELLKFEPLKPFRTPILDNLRNSGPRAAGLIGRLLGDLPDDFSRSYLQQYGASLMKDVGRWVSDAVASRSSVKELRELLELLEMVASKGSFACRLKEDDMKNLWIAFTAGEERSEYSEVFFTWLQAALTKRADFLTDNEFAVSVFSTLLCKMSEDMIEKLGVAAFACFQQFFLYSNFRSQNLRYREDYVTSRIGVELDGLDTLILFVLRTREEAVLQRAIRLMAQLYLRINREAYQGILSRFVSDRMDSLQRLAIEESDQAIDRTLKLLTGLVKAYDYIRVAKPAHSTYQDWQTVYYRLATENVWKSIALSKNDTLGTLRRSIAFTNRYTPDFVKMEAGQLIYTFIDDDKVLGKLGHALHFVARQEEHEYVMQDPSEFLGHNEEAQDLLFQLLSRGNKPYRDEVWFLLARLPTNYLIQMKVKELGVTFRAMAHSPSFHKQLFCLLALQHLNRTYPTFKDTFKSHCPNELFRVLKRISHDGDLLTYFESYDSGLVLQYAQLMLQLSYAFRTPVDCPLSKTEVVLMVLDLLYLYAKHVQETSEMTNPSVPNAAWQTIMEYVGVSDFQELRSLLVEFKHFDKLIYHSLQRAKNAFFSFQMKDFFQRASLPPLSLLPVLSEKLVKAIPEAVDSTETTRAYFSLTSKLIKQQKGTSNEEYLEVLFQFMRNRAPEPHPKADDKGMSGAMKIMKAIIRNTPSLATRELAEYVLLTCLIDFEETHESQSGKPKCKSETTRLAAFKLLATLTQSPPVRSYVLSVLSNFHRDTSWRKPKLLCWLNAYNTFEKSATGFVGLRNLGCTCYMNSMLQQLFMIQSFREGLFQSESTGEPAESVLFQLQKIMTGLERSDKMFVQTRGLCAAYVNWEGQPINPNEQIDVDEFFNGLMDKVEENLKPTIRCKLVEEHFRGILTTQCIGRGSCTHRSERDELFMTLPVEIKNKKSILESLEALTAGETLEGDNAYACDFCPTKVTARRRLCIRSLPNFLILTMRRFDFDMDTMNRVKLNNYCEFPLNLDMEPYTLEAVMRKDAQQAQAEARAQGRDPDPLPSQEEIPSDYFQYNLRGVVIHMGLAEAGHYYSYIIDKHTGKWVEFNDANVEEFNIDNLAKEAFGAVDKPMGGMQGEEAGKMRNAYVLLYERTAKYQLKGKDDPVPVPQQEQPTSVPQAPSVQQLLERVHKSNQRYWRKRRVFSPEYSHFLLALTSQSDQEVLRFVVRHYFTAQIRSKEHAQQLMKYVYEKAPASDEIAAWILEMLSFEPMLKELFFECPLPEAKKFAVAVADRCLRNVDQEKQMRFLRRLLQVLHKLPSKLTIQYSGYFELIYRVVLIRPESASEVDLCRKLLAVVFSQPLSPEPEDSSDSQLPDIGLGREGEELVAKFPAPTGSQSLSYSFQIAIVGQCLEHLPSDLISMLKDPSKIAALVKGAYGRFGANHMSRLYRSLMHSDTSVFPSYLFALLQEVRNNDYDQHKSPLIQLKRLIAINEYTPQIMKEIVQILTSNIQYIRATESLINFLYRLVARFPAVRTWLASNLQHLMSLNVWRQKYLTWNNQSTNGLYLTKVYNPHSQFIDYHPSGTVSNRITTILNGKVPEHDREFDSDDDLYDEPLAAKSSAEFLYKDELCYRVEVLESFLTLHYVKVENLDQAAPMFVSSDDDRLLKTGTRIKQVVLK